MSDQRCAGKIRIVLADDHAAARDSIRGLLERQPDLEVVGVAADGREAVEQTLRLHPDVIIMDINMPFSGIEAAGLIRRQDTRVWIIAISVILEPNMVAGMNQAGADECMPKTAPPQRLFEAIRQHRDAARADAAPV